MFAPLMVGFTLMYWTDRGLTALKQRIAGVKRDLTTKEFQEWLKDKDSPDFKLFRDRWEEFEHEGYVYRMYRVHQARSATEQQS